MQKVFSSKSGASLLEILATVTLISICILLIYNILHFNVRHNLINQEKSIHANIANAALNYIKSNDFDLIRDYLDSENNGYYAIVNLNDCNTLFVEDEELCRAVLGPTINNKVFDHSNLNIYLLPYNDRGKLDALKHNPISWFPELLRLHINGIDTTQMTYTNRNVIRVIVIVDSNIGSLYDFLLEGVITSE